MRCIGTVVFILAIAVQTLPDASAQERGAQPSDIEESTSDNRSADSRERPGRGRARGPRLEIRADQQVFHFLLERHAEIRRTVKRLENGVETLTESDNPAVTAKIQNHVASMHRRVKEGRGLRHWDELFAALFKHHAAISMAVENTAQGVKVTETSADRTVVPLIQAHADVVSLFVKRGFDEAHKNHAVPAAEKANIEPPTKQEPDIPLGPLGDTIRLGREIVEKTTSHPLSKPFVGNALNCTSCHLQNGTHPKAATFVGVATAYPAWSPRENRVITLEDRILNCFMRSGNGTRPPNGSNVSVAIAAYITWLSRELPIRMNVERPLGPSAIPALSLDVALADAVRGKELYARRCADCHQADGQGNDDNPPVWGGKSFNQGAGLANTGQLAAYLKVAMPIDDANLTEQEALDIAAYVNSHERPKFRLEDHLPK